MNIIVNTPALRSSGALSIYLQFINHLSFFVGNNRYYIFVDSSVAKPIIKGVTYIVDDDHSWSHRLYWDFLGLKKWLRKQNIVPDVVVSLQNTGVNIDCRQIIYYHQSLPFYNRKWNFFNKEERLLWIYKNIYPLFVSLSLTGNTEIVVQVPYIKRNFIKKFHVQDDRVHVLFPDTEKIDEKMIQPYNFETNYYHFIYPAIPKSYKEHKTFCFVMDRLRKNNRDLYDRIKIHLTLNKGVYESFDSLINKLNLEGCFVFEGRIEHNRLLSMYKSATGLLYPSTIETIGLPLLEAASFGLPIIVSDLDYSREVLEDYKGVTYVASYDYDSWAEKIGKVCLENKKFASLQQKESSWERFFNLIDKCI